MPQGCLSSPAPGGSCVSALFPSNGISYSQVCGRVVGYQFGTVNAVRKGITPFTLMVSVSQLGHLAIIFELLWQEHLVLVC